MQPQDSFTIPRRSLDVEDYIDIARRHKGWIFGPFFVAVVASVVTAFLWPNTYISIAMIKVNPQMVPEAYIQSNVNQAMSDRITSMSTTVESRSVLTSIIQTNDLYPRERARLPMEDVIEMMRKRIKISPVVSVGANGQASTRVPAFTISFQYAGRFQAQKVVSELTAKFINQNQLERSSSSLSTTNLLREQYEGAKKELEGVEARMAAFRVKNMGNLPDQMQQNVQQMNAIQMRMGNLNTAISGVNQRKLLYETQLRIYRDNAVGVKESANESVQSQKSEKLIEAENEVKFWEMKLAQLRELYKETFPDVKNAVSMLASSKKKKETALKEDEAKKSEPKPSNPLVVRETREMENRVRTIQSQIDAADLEAQEYKQELGQLTTALKTYQARLEGTPFSEREFAELTRERDVAKAKFLELDQKWTRSSLAQEMENRKQGENLEVLDPATLPETPSDPKREYIIGAGAGIGLILGLIFAAGREMKDTSLKNLKDVRAYTQLPILGSVPLLENDLVVRRRRRLSILAWSLSCMLGVAIMSASVIYYHMTKV